MSEYPQVKPTMQKLQKPQRDPSSSFKISFSAHDPTPAAARDVRLTSPATNKKVTKTLDMRFTSNECASGNVVGDSGQHLIAIRCCPPAC